MSVEKINIDNDDIKFTVEQIQYIEKIGKARCEAKPGNIKYNDSNYHSDNGERDYPHILGFAAEYAYSILTGKPVDDRILSHGDNIDFDGIEIKSSTWEGSDIELKIKKKEYDRKKPIVYVLARVAKNYDRVQFIGSISRSKFDVSKYEKKHKFVENWCMFGKDLKPIIPAVFGTDIKVFELKRNGK